MLPTKRDQPKEVRAAEFIPSGKRAVQLCQWQEENREAIAAYNQHADEQGAFSDGNRSF